MTYKEAALRIEEHMRIHKARESRAVWLTKALEMAIEVLRREATRAGNTPQPDPPTRILSAIDLAHYVIARTNKLGDGVSLSKLQKVLYFIQAEYLTVFDRPCFAEDIEAWKLGVAVPVVYQEFLGHGAGRIWYDEKHHPQWLQLSVSSEEKYHIDCVIDELQEYSASDLIRLTMNQDPWKKTYREGEKRIIPLALIQDFFRD